MPKRDDRYVDARDYARLYRLSRYLSRDGDTAGDDVQEAALKFLRTFDASRGERNRWLRRCLLTAVADRRRREGYTPEPIEHIPGPEPQAPPSHLSTETAVWLTQALAELPPSHATAFLMDLDDASLREIGSRLGVSHETARKYVERARRALRDLF